jgi:hypothetical protein
MQKNFDICGLLIDFIVSKAQEQFQHLVPDSPVETLARVNSDGIGLDFVGMER